MAMNIRRSSSNRKTSEQAPEERITTLHSWMQKNEQMISSISGRLAVVETRLSLVAPISDLESRQACSGPIQRLVQETKRHANVRAWARVLDHDLAALQERLQTQDQQLKEITGQLTAFPGTASEITTTSDTLKVEIAQSTQSLADRLAQLEQPRGRLFTMRLGRFELPLELSSILIGGLAFTVAGLVALGQKEVLGDPLFLAGIGILFLASAVVKRLIVKTRSPLTHALGEPLPLHKPGTCEENV
jgi:chromosome segregation ATPase